ncbi:EAL domain-containing protein (putative c-di-GMP-specific phosphodiesterase class I)/GGDEF domain-containing protein [Bacillus sp. SORGH_AS 510]|uniref:putative bifunctional diguanylate cyclase/phosphodiesterase n=1 Tax=Bacillus sp. SORGH_AS_0510 TaxID=3041771 RepID=UPI002782DE9E|nr:GGDEF domain-containing phosphodiesterase [Bacillus sp. SORGH_AS_0510]MDQ1144252.1 EAL domain-containing protein (putative c-di-GMP-specific phosphodiesterase class I)/GGDEF domain-containing protein [Bacillus sp. SORGH_AS_0510]
MEHKPENHTQKHAERTNFELLQERLSLTLAFSKRYQMSAAVCYLRFHLPLELTQQKDDEIEQALAGKILARLKRTIRDIDTVVKINQSDFVILIADITEHDCEIICTRILRSISDTYTVDYHHFSINGNMGICMYPYGAEGPDELQSIAKTAMYDAEELGDNQYVFYRGELSQAAYRKVLIENDLPYALKKEQLYVHYQPQYYLKKRTIEGVEALIRWNHPSLGPISPGEFIQYADEAGVSHNLFFWMFEEVCNQIHSETERNLKYSINLSVNQLLLPYFLPEITKLIQRYSVPASRITLEITENIEVYTVKKVNDTLRSLKELGFSLALDDFGNGYFSFADFIKLPIDFIKLDRNFVSSLLKNKQHEGVVSPIIQMTHNLGLQVIIEGIEDPIQFSVWANLECDIIQGYFISKPLSDMELTDTIVEIEKRVNASY